MVALVNRCVFILGYLLLVPALVVFWYGGGRRMDRAQSYSLWIMGVGIALVLWAACSSQQAVGSGQ